jgi:hypothetical protein
MHNTIGLFGTCGNSTWRDWFIKEYSERNILFYNPQLPPGMWTPGCAKEENDHLINDGVILFPVTNETTGQGSLAEIGFSILASLRRNPERYFIFMIDDDCIDPDATEAARTDSVRSRKLVKSKLIEVAKENDGVFLVDTLTDMFDISIKLINHIAEFNSVKSTYKQV